MSTSELDQNHQEQGQEKDVPIPLPQFERVLRGYDPQAVTSFLRTALVRVRELEGKVVDLQNELMEARRLKGTAAAPTTLGSSQDRYEVFSGHVADVVRAFDKDVERIRTEAEAEAKRIVDEARKRAEQDTREVDDRSREAKSVVEQMLREARDEAEGIRAQANAKAEEVKAKADRALEDARARAIELISDLEARRTSALTDMRTLRDAMLEAAGTLDASMNGQQAVADVTVAEKDVAVTEGSQERSELIGPGR